MARKKAFLLSRDLRLTLGVCLQNLRECKRPGESRAKVARELEVSSTTLCDIENGKSEPSLAFIHIIARAYKVHPNVILGVVHMKEFDFDTPLDAEAVGLIRLHDILSPESVDDLRKDLQQLGYKHT
ncbi:MAG: helix-turn-helix transcriptional regulator [Chloroflexi bacterium]|nr:helix-turn-helix transcriptional regulator [Chloroflexota bacterium]